MISQEALAATVAVVGVGHDARFTEVEQLIGRGPRFTSEALQAALGAGLVVQLGKPGTRLSRWAATDAGTSAASEALEGFDRRQEQSTRDAVLAIVRREGVVQTGRRLATLLRRESPAHGSLGQHSLNHQLHAMRKAGLIEARIVRNGNTQGLADIRVGSTPWHEAPGGWPPIPAAPEVEATPPLEPGTVDLRWPELERLRVRMAAGEDARRRSAALVDAAELLAQVDPEESERLFDRANGVAADFALTPLEDEYLRFAAPGWGSSPASQGHASESGS